MNDAGKRVLCRPPGLLQIREKRQRHCLAIVICIVLLKLTSAQIDVPNTPGDICSKNGDCQSCITHAVHKKTCAVQFYSKDFKGNASKQVSTEFQCYWCPASKTCRIFTVDGRLPDSTINCPRLQYNVATCAVDTLGLIIAAGVGIVTLIATVTLIVVGIGILCCKRKKDYEGGYDSYYEDDDEDEEEVSY